MYSTHPDVAFKSNNPGAVKYGNFINYYQFHPVENRLRMFPKDIWKVSNNNTFNCLDIGCNAGDLTRAVQEFLKQHVCSKTKIQAIDIDETLITRAKEADDSFGCSTYECMDFMKLDERKIIHKYLNDKDIVRFDVTFCFSVTMWIHLNHGDEGLKQFLKSVCELSDLVVVEPQPWKCYKSAVKRLKSANHDFAMFKNLKICIDVEDVIETIIKECMFSKIYETPHSTWGRKILFYQRENINR